MKLNSLHIAFNMYVFSQKIAIYDSLWGYPVAGVTNSLHPRGSVSNFTRLPAVQKRLNGFFSQIEN